MKAMIVVGRMICVIRHPVTSEVFGPQDRTHVKLVKTCRVREGTMREMAPSA